MASILWQGDFYRLNSFSLVNQQLVDEIERLGINIDIAPTDKYQDINLENIPDIYVFHNYPYDVIQAPGKFNIFYFPYEFFEFYSRDYFLANGINNKFDMVVVPSNFTRNACLKSGVTIPVEVIPEGFSKDLFHPDVNPVSLKTRKSYKFINLGGAFDRKGHDILVKAYIDEFSFDDDVTLILKAFSYEHTIPWIEEILSKTKSMESPPEIIFEHENMENIAGYYTFADIGVYPYRGEGFGLTVLETIACGRKVIVSAGGSTDDFCNLKNAIFIPTERKETSGKKHLEPEYMALRKLMRTQFEIGKPGKKSIQHIAQSVDGFQWKNSAENWKNLFDRIISRKSSVPEKNLEINSLVALFNDFDEAISPWKEYSPHTHKKESISPWKIACKEIEISFSNQLTKLSKITFSKPFDRGIVAEKIIGEAGLSLEYFIATKNNNPDTQISLFHDIFPINESMGIEHRERGKCSIDYKSFPRYQSLLKWRYDKEIEMADNLVVLDSVTAQVMKRNWPKKKSIVVPPPIKESKFFPRRNSNTINFLFWGFDPFRRGILNLLKAWDMLQLKDAKLICLLETKLPLSSKEILKYLIFNPTIEINHFDGNYTFSEILLEIDVQIIPSYGDGFFSPAANGMAMGKPIIVSYMCGLQDIIPESEKKFIVDPSSVESIANSISHYFSLRKSQLNEIGKMVSDKANKYTKTRFADELAKKIIAS